MGLLCRRRSVLTDSAANSGALVELLATCTAAEPAIALGGALRSLRDGLRSAFQAPHLRPPLCEKRPYTQPSPRRPGVVARALTEPLCRAQSRRCRSATALHRPKRSTCSCHPGAARIQLPSSSTAAAGAPPPQ